MQLCRCLGYLVAVCVRDSASAVHEMFGQVRVELFLSVSLARLAHV